MTAPRSLLQISSDAFVEARTRDGFVWALGPAGGASGCALKIQLPTGRAVEIRDNAAPCPVLGPCQAVVDEDGRELAKIRATDWTSPASIPAIDRPGALPSGAGSMILGLLSALAAHAGRDALRYHGPYPTSALFESLHWAFSCDADEDDFVHGAQAHAETGTSVEVPVDFVPTPFWVDRRSPEVWVTGRERVERVFLGGHAYSARDLFRQLRPTPQGIEAVFAFGPVAYARRCTFDGLGTLQGPVEAVPTCTSDLVGAPIPRPLLSVVAQASVAQAPTMLRHALALTFERCPFVWGDTAQFPARFEHDGIHVHAALGEVLPALSATDGLGLLLAAIDPVARRLSAQALARASA